MADLILPARFNSQPQYRAELDSGNPITRGIVEAWNASGGIIGVRGNRLTPLASASVAAAPSGIGYFNSGAVGSGQGFELPALDTQISATNEATMLMLVDGGAGVTQQGGLAHTHYQAQTDHYPYDNLIYLTLFSQSRWVNGVASKVDLSKPHVAVVQYKNGAQRFSQNGITVTSAAAAVNPLFVSPARIIRSTSASFAYMGKMPLVVIWNRYLSDSEVAMVSANPWQLFKAPTPRLWPRDSASTSYSLTVDAGSYALTGQATGVRASRTLAAAQGSYALTGQAAGLLRRYPLIAAQGSYALTGQATGLRASRALAAAQGSYALTGQSAGLLRGIKITAEQGSYTLTGQATGLRISRLIAAAQGSYGLTGQDVTLTYSGSGNKLLAAGQGSYTLTGQDVGLLASRKLTAEQGSYSHTGQNVSLLRARLISLSAGGYTLTGQPANLLRALRLTAAQGSYGITGQAVALSYSGAVASYSLTAAFGLYTLTGQTVSLTLTIPVYSPDTRPHYTVTPGAPRLGYAAEAVQTGRLGHSNERIAAKRLGARTK